MIRWADTIQIKSCATCPFMYVHFRGSDDTTNDSCNLSKHYGKENDIIFDGGIPDFCPLLNNNVIVRVEDNPAYGRGKKTKK